MSIFGNSVGGGLNPLEMASKLQNESAQTEATLTQMEKTAESVKAMKRDVRSEIFDGLKKSVDKVRI